MPRVRIKPRTAAQMSSVTREAIAEVWSPKESDHPGRGCLIAAREVQNATTRGVRGLVIEVYAADPGVYVRINGRDYKPAR